MLKPNEWYIAETGGGCTAWRLDLSPTSYILLTDDLTHTFENQIEIGVYENDECVAYKEFLLQNVTLPKSTDK